jgi:hypothetical protein
MVLERGKAGNHDGCVYTTAEKAVAEVWRLAAYFASLVLDGTLRTTAEWMAQHKESLLRIVEQDMRIADTINKKRRAAAAEAARIAAERAAEEARLAAEAARIAAEKAVAEAAEQARLAAEAAERQRLWDEAHPEEAAIRDAEKRAAAARETLEQWRSAVRSLEKCAEVTAAGISRNKEKAAHVQEKIAAAEALEARKADSEEITSREQRQINHLPQLRIELRNLLESIRTKEIEPACDFTARIAAAETQAAEAQVAADTTAAEVQQLKDAWAAKQA